MKLALDFMRQKHETLINDYRIPDGMFRESCGMIACEMAEKFLLEGYSPHIRIIRGVANEIGNRLSLTPKIYDNRITWGAHQVCCIGENAYDPMLGSPVKLMDYLSEAFGSDCEMVIFVREEYIEKFLQR